MLTVKTYIDKSPIAGMGCFAAEDIKEGDLIWELNPFLDRIYTEENLKFMSELEVNFVKTYAYLHNGLYFLCIDSARFFNHSSENYNTLDPFNEYKTYALRDIKKGEEILSNYGTFGGPEDVDFNMNL